MSTEDEVKEGWGWPLLAKKAHYFVDAKALCGRWMFTGELDDEPFAESPDDCVVCRRKLGTKLEKANG